MALSKAQRKKVYERVSGRFRRLARKLGKKNWKEVTIDGKTFKEAYEEEVKREEDLIAKGEESRLRRSRKESGPEIILRELEQEQPTPRRKRKSNMDWISDSSDGTHDETCTCNKCMGAWGDENLVNETVGSIPESDEERAKRKELERRANEYFEAICTERICPTCKSSVCHCEEEE